MLLAGSCLTLTKLNINISRSTQPQTNPFSGFVEELARLSETSRNILQHLNINVMFYVDDFPLNEDQFHLLDPVISNRTAFPQLKKFELNITVRNPYRWENNGQVLPPESFTAAAAEIAKYHTSLFGKLRSTEGLEFGCFIQRFNWE